MSHLWFVICDPCNQPLCNYPLTTNSYRPKTHALLFFILLKQEKGLFTAEKATEFLKEYYGSFKESATAEDITEVGSILTSVATGFCDALSGAQTLGGAYVQKVAAGVYSFLFSDYPDRNT